MKRAFLFGIIFPLQFPLGHCFRHCAHAYDRETAAFSWVGLAVFLRMRGIWVISPPFGQPSPLDSTKGSSFQSTGSQILIKRWFLGHSNDKWMYLSQQTWFPDSLKTSTSRHAYRGPRYSWTSWYLWGIDTLQNPLRLGTTLANHFLSLTHLTCHTECSLGCEVVIVGNLLLKRSLYLFSDVNCSIMCR